MLNLYLEEDFILSPVVTQMGRPFGGLIGSSNGRDQGTKSDSCRKLPPTERPQIIKPPLAVQATRRLKFAPSRSDIRMGKNG